MPNYNVINLHHNLESEFERIEARLIYSVSKLMMMRDSEAARALGLSKREFQRRLRKSNINATIDDWTRFCEYSGMQLDSLLNGRLLRHQAIHCQRIAISKPISKNNRDCSQLFQHRFSKLLWTRTYHGISNPFQLQQLNLQGEDLSDCALPGANLLLSDLSFANLKGINLRASDLYWANLEGAVLVDADLSGAKLPWAILNGANLSSTLLDRADLFGATFDETTLLPFDRFEAQQRGMEFISADIWKQRKQMDVPNLTQAYPSRGTLPMSFKQNLRRLESKRREHGCSR